jgi:L-asparaginase
MSRTNDLPPVAIIAAGGTIECVGADRLDTAWYPDTKRTLKRGDLVASVPELRQFARIEEHAQPLSKRGPTAADWLALHRRITDAIDRGAQGIVVTHGTNPLEELAYFLHLTVRRHVPVVVTGAMRPASALGADGPTNLVGAVRVAASADAHSMGVLVVFNDTIHSARDVSKTSTHRLQAFAAPGAGPIGYADADRVVFIARPHRRHTASSEFDVSALAALPRVDVTVSHVDADGVMIDAAVAARARGIVNAGSGAGRPTADENDAMDRAVARGVTVCQASRTGSGRVTLGPWLRRRGVVAAGDLPPWKARILLSLALTRTEDTNEIQRIFDEY